MAEIRWFGHTCFRIKAKEATVFMDPVARATGFAMSRQNADIVTLSGASKDEVDLSAIRPGYQIISGPGEYEMHDVFVTGVRTYQDEESADNRRYNTAYVVELEGMKIGHLGSLGHSLSEEQSEVLKDADIVLAAAGGGLLSAEKMASLVTELSPKMVIPMRFRTGKGDKDLNDAQAFCKQLGTEMPAVEEKLVVKASDLSDTMRIVVLAPDS